MGLYNLLSATMVCPRCNQTVELEIQIYIGHKQLYSYRIGDAVNWLPNSDVEHGGFPPSGSMEGEGYTECPQCKKDFFLVVQIRDGKIAGVNPDLSKKPYIQ